MRRANDAGFTLLEMMVVVAIVGILAAMAATSLDGVRRAARVNGEARLLVQRLQTARSAAVSQGWNQGYLIATAAATDPNLQGRAFTYRKNKPAIVPTTYTAGVLPPNDDTLTTAPDVTPQVGGQPLVLITPPAGYDLAGLFSIGYDINGLATLIPTPGGNPPFLCIKVDDAVDPTLTRWVFLTTDGTVKVQKNETICP